MAKRRMWRPSVDARKAAISLARGRPRRLGRLPDEARAKAHGPQHLLGAIEAEEEPPARGQDELEALALDEVVEHRHAHGVEVVRRVELATDDANTLATRAHLEELLRVEDAIDVEEETATHRHPREVLSQGREPKKRRRP
jgi:hypothetical protein